MSAARPYRFYLALFLLALYAFIATPVQWWHHHPAAKTMSTVSAKGTDKAGIAAASSSITTPDCPVCAHQYAVYYNDHTAPAQIASLVFPSPATAALQVLCVAPPGDLPNKSPPATCLLKNDH